MAKRSPQKPPPMTPPSICWRTLAPPMPIPN